MRTRLVWILAFAAGLVLGALYSPLRYTFLSASFALWRCDRLTGAADYATPNGTWMPVRAAPRATAKANPFDRFDAEKSTPRGVVFDEPAAAPLPAGWKQADPPPSTSRPVNEWGDPAAKFDPSTAKLDDPATARPLSQWSDSELARAARELAAKEYATKELAAMKLSRPAQNPPKR